jgi:GxxExxY protein
MITDDHRQRINDTSNGVIGAAIDVHRIMGPGLLESVYQECLSLELTLGGIPVACQIQTPLYYKGHRLRNVYRADMIVDRNLLVEVKSVDGLAAIHESQVLTYLRLTGLPLGLLLNFNETLMRKGIKRLVNGL